MTFLQLLKNLAPELSEQMTMLSIYGAVAVALLLCFFGFRLRQLWYSLLVFAAGALLGYWVSRMFVPDKLWLCLLIGLAAGLIAAAFTFRIMQTVAFLLAFGCLFALAGEVLGDQYPVASVIVGIVLGVIAGLLAVKFQYWAVVFVTAIAGGWRAAFLLRRCIASLTPQATLILAGCLMAAGALFQILTTRKLVEK